jgi:predicted site-specific integrase-resolvase
MLGMSHRIVLRWIREGRVPSEVTESGELRLRREDVMRLTVDGSQQGCSEDAD